MPVDRRRRRSVTARLAGVVSVSAAGRRAAALRDELRARRVPLHWTNMFGVIAFACVLVLFVSGFLLMFAYTPSGTRVTYDGPYAPLAGAEMSKALQSTLAITFEVPGGLLVRQAHHWAGLLLPAAILLQLAVSFFTGAFRRPRRLSWVLLFGLLITALLGGWSGYALPDDMLSGTGLRIVEGIVLGIPVVGTWLSALLFGGEFPGRIIENLYPIHVAVVPALLVLLLAARARRAYTEKPAQFAGPGRTEERIVGVPVLPELAARAGGLLAIATGVIVLLAATVTISPIWLYGPSSPGDASAGSQPDWYTGFLDGALRLVPPDWEFEWLGRTWTLAILIPLAVVGLYLVAIAVYPFVEEWVTGDHRDHHLLDRPRNEPTRTGLGVSAIVFYASLWGAGSADLVATHFHLAVESVVAGYQVLVVVGPVAAFLVTRRVCLALQKRDRDILLHGYETGRIVRLPGGEYVEVHGAVDAAERYRLAGPAAMDPVDARPDEDGRLRLSERLRTTLARVFFEDRLEPVDSQTRDEAVAGGRVDEAITEPEETRAGAA
ncbi:cytochrome bc1 complex cytochrome b subunit [Leifsonia sp. 21MFCrub1.1]|uniref:cytochrome bc1 complex cytochrome b subunit n=1 Tax=Leifsonia sp. 21MFCrub1.1 TaxID=1798223 RepID=UPI000892A206|nr:cytochrome b N-terminal domain-containing protein [Leifsonia sp. 21MFCrub1.1]SEA39356.1 ubiquinol-cytochrome c reductase cytochrome b subunit [Leifsonia sp. 21MFCrub1.1]